LHDHAAAQPGTHYRFGEDGDLFFAAYQPWFASVVTGGGNAAGVREELVHLDRFGAAFELAWRQWSEGEGVLASRSEGLAGERGTLASDAHHACRQVRLGAEGAVGPSAGGAVRSCSRRSVA